MYAVGVSVQAGSDAEREARAHQLEDGDLHHALVEVRGLVFDDFDGNDVVRFEVLTLDDLAKGALAEHIQYQVPATDTISTRRKEKGKGTGRMTHLCVSSAPSQSLT